MATLNFSYDQLWYRKVVCDTERWQAEIRVILLGVMAEFREEDSSFCDLPWGKKKRILPWKRRGNRRKRGRRWSEDILLLRVLRFRGLSMLKCHIWGIIFLSPNIAPNHILFKNYTKDPANTSSLFHLFPRPKYQHSAKQAAVSKRLVNDSPEDV